MGQAPASIDLICGGLTAVSATDEAVQTRNLLPASDSNFYLGASDARWVECHAMSGAFRDVAIGDEDDAGAALLTKWQTQTTDATPTALATVTLDDTHVYWFEAKVIARKNDGSARAFYIRSTMAYREGGGATLGTVASLVTDESSDYDATFVVSGNDVILQVTGANSSTINWKAFLSYQAVG